jgi:hypothetical protein
MSKDVIYICGLVKKTGNKRENKAGKINIS